MIGRKIDIFYVIDTDTNTAGHFGNLFAVVSMATQTRRYAAMLTDLGGRLWRIPRWRVLVFFYGSVFVGVTAVSLSHRKREKSRETAGARGKKKKASSSDLLSVLLKLAPIIFPSYTCKAAQQLCVYTLLLFFRVFSYSWLADIGSAAIKCLVNMDWDGLFFAQSRFMSLCIPVSVINAFARYQQHQLAMTVRTHLLDFINVNFINDHLTFYRVSSYGKNLMSTVDQRITVDVEQFSEKLSETWGSLVRPTFETFVYCYNIARNLGGVQLFLFSGYFAISSYWLKTIMPNFGAILAKQKDLEGDFRNCHSSIIEHAEEIALLRGSSRENEIAEQTFRKIKLGRQDVLEKRAMMSFLDTTIIKHFGALVSYEVMIPAMYLGKEGVNLDTVGDRTQYMLQSIQYFNTLASALNAMYNNAYVGFTELAGMANRVEELVTQLGVRGGADGKDTVADAVVEMARQALEEQGHGCSNSFAASPMVVHSRTNASVEFQHATIISPEGRLLVFDMNLTIRKGDHTIIEGVNGSGKSSILRTIGGLWPLCAGKIIIPPAKQQILFMPQKSYVFVGTLREQLIYPDTPHCELSEDDLNRHIAGLEKLLKIVGLDSAKLLADSKSLRNRGECTGWDEVFNWDDILSGGERQRLGFARVFYHCPDFVCLDEATSAVSHDMEDKLFSMCKQRNITMISIAHHAELRKHHKHILTIKGDELGGWSVGTV